MKHMTQLIWPLLLVALLTGCAAAVPTDVPAGEPAATETRIIAHAMGETEVPVDPQRVVVLDTGEIDSALALGASIVGAPVSDIQAYQGYLAEQLEGITDIGTISEPNLETIVSLDPDLILGSKQRYEEIYEQLSAIAPTALTESLRVPWQDNFQLHAEALGKTAEADELLAAYDARTSAIRAALGEDLPTISIVRFRPGQVRLYLKSSYIGYILQDVGLPRPPAQDEDLFSSEISLEQIADVDADYIFITGYAQDDSDMDTFLESEMWQTLGAVQNERAIDVNDDHWIAGLGVLGANLVLDDLTEILGLDISDEDAAAVTDAFPVTIEHKYGRTTIDAKPERVVTVGLTDQDAVLALGATPVGTTTWLGDHPGNIFPWAVDLVEGDLPQIVGDGNGLNFEAIAALNPDVILALYTGITEDEYELLSEIAPTVAPPAGYVDYGLPWQESTLIAGRVLGENAKAEALLADVEEKIAQIRADNPHFVGATGAVAAMYEGIWVYGPEDGRARLLSMLGFELPEALIEALPAEDFGGNLSLERADLLDLDLMVWLSFGENIEERGGPVYQTLPVYTEGREVFVDDLSEGTDSALSFVTVLSLPHLLDEFVPLVVEAMAGTN